MFTLSNISNRFPVLKILQITDLHILPEPGDTLMGVNTLASFRLVMEHAYSIHGKFDLIILSGDIGQEPGVASYQRVLETLQDYHTPSLCLPGNHDDFGLMQRIFNTETVNCRKQRQLGDWQILALNSQKINSPLGELTTDELSFLSDNLAARPDTPTLIAMHHHCISSGSSWMDTMQIVNSADLLAILHSHPQVKLVISGHVHQELAAFQGTIGFFSAPATCFQFQHYATEFQLVDTPPGYRVFELFEDGSYEPGCFYLPAALPELKLHDRSY